MQRDAIRRSHFIGGDLHDTPMPKDHFVWLVRNACRILVVRHRLQRRFQTRIEHNFTEDNHSEHRYTEATNGGWRPAEAAGFESGRLLMAGQELGLLRHISGMLALTFLLSGCLSISYVDSANRRHVIGFVDVVVEQAAPSSAAPEPTTISMTTVGVHVYSGAPEGSGLAIGYVQDTMVIMPDNSCVSLERPGACPPTSTRSTAEMQAKETNK